MDSMSQQGAVPSGSSAAKWFGDLLDLRDAEQFRVADAGMGEEIQELFRQEIESSLEGLESAIPAGDWLRVREHAHSLQGMGGVVGAPEISLVGLALSNAAKTDQKEIATNLTMALRGWAGEWRSSTEDSAPRQRPDLELQGRVLIVDDEEPNRRFLRELMEGCGVEVMVAAGGEEALNLMKMRQPDVALVDVNMPGMDGYSLCRTLKSTPGLRRISVLMVTARNQVEDIETGFELGAFDYIRKPYHSRELLVRVRNALQLKRREDELRAWKENLSRELRMAGVLQAALFNPVPLSQGHCDVRTAYSPSQQIGGDCFDVVMSREGILTGYVADVAGHGVASALVSTLLKGLFVEMFALPGPPPLEEIGNRVHARFRELIADPELYATGFLFRLDPTTGKFEGLNAGHPMPLVFDEEGRERKNLLHDVGGMPIGMMPAEVGDPYLTNDVMQIHLPDGVGLYLYTDGLVEARNDAGHEIGPEGLAQTCGLAAHTSSGRGDPGAVLAALRSKGYGLAEDDCTLMSIQLIHPDRIVMEGSLKLKPEVVSEASAEAQERLVRAGWEEDSAARARLVMLEHLMNVSRHAGLEIENHCEIRLTLEENGRVCEMLFRDPGLKWIPDPVEASTDGQLPLEETSEGGRGCRIIQKLCTHTRYFRRDNWNHHVLLISQKVSNTTHPVPSRTEQVETHGT